MGKAYVTKELQTIVCKHCKGEYIFMAVFRNKDEYTDGYFDPTVWEQVSSKFCPLCGKEGG